MKKIFSFKSAQNGVKIGERMIVTENWKLCLACSQPSNREVFIFVFLTFGTRELILLIIIFDSIKCKMPTKSWNYFVFPLQVHLQIRNTLENFHILIEVAVLPIIHIDIGCWINKRKSCATALAKQVVDNVSFFLIEVVICYFQLQIFQSIVSI